MSLPSFPPRWTPKAGIRPSASKALLILAFSLPSVVVLGASSMVTIAQARTAYRAAIGSSLHNQAEAAGYDSGGSPFIAENNASEANMSSQGTVPRWQGDTLHRHTIVSGRYQQAGTRAAKAGKFVYDTLDTAHVVAGAPPTSEGTGPVPTNTPGPGTAAPFELATPQADGSIIHIVEAGQTLIEIAAGYEMPLADLLALNDLTENSWIYPDDKLLIQPAYTPTPTASPTTTQTPPPPTRRPTFTPTIETPVALAQASASEEPRGAPTATNALAQLELDAERRPLIVGIVLGTFLILVASLVISLRRPR